jgi:hypothetical protein
VIDAVGGTSLEAHRAALERVTQAGTKPISWVQLICELQRDWQRKGRHRSSQISCSQWKATKDGNKRLGVFGLALPYLQQALAIAKFDPGMYEVVETYSGTA